MEYENWDFYREHLGSYDAFEKHIKALNRDEPIGKVIYVNIDVFQAVNAVWTLGTAKLYYWILKLVEQGLVSEIEIRQNPIPEFSHHADAEVGQCVFYFKVMRG